MSSETAWHGDFTSNKFHSFARWSTREENNYGRPDFTGWEFTLHWSKYRFVYTFLHLKERVIPNKKCKECYEVYTGQTGLFFNGTCLYTFPGAVDAVGAVIIIACLFKWFHLYKQESIYKYMKQKLWTPVYGNYADGGVWNLAQL